MVDEIKKQMRRFEQLIGLRGKFIVTARESTEKLLDALDWKYKRDVESSLRLHSLEFFHALMEGQHTKKERKEKEDAASGRSKLRSKKPKEEGAEEKKAEEEEPEKDGVLSDEVIFDEVIRVDPKDIDDWKDLTTLSRIYYQMEHPRSEGLIVKRKIAKRKKTDKFTDMDFIEWRAAQYLCLNDLEEWAQRKSDARLYARQIQPDDYDVEDPDENGELAELFELLDPSGRKYEKKEEAASPTQREEPSGERPFRFRDDCIDDWTESYSEDSERSDIEDSVHEIEDFPDELEKKLAEFDEVSSRSGGEVEEDISAILSRYPEFSKYRDPIFEEMDRTQTIEEWFALYEKTRVVPEEEQKEPATEVLDTITEGVEEEPDESETEAAVHEEKGFGEEKEDAEEEEQGEKLVGEFGEEQETRKEDEGVEEDEQKETEDEKLVKEVEEQEPAKEKEGVEEAAEQEEVEGSETESEEQENVKENEGAEEAGEEERGGEKLEGEFDKERETAKEKEGGEEEVEDEGESEVQRTEKEKEGTEDSEQDEEEGEKPIVEQETAKKKKTSKKQNKKK